MVNLVIDIGNTLQKLAVFDENRKIVKFLQEKQLSVPILEEILARYPVRSSIVSSVGKDDEELFRWLGSRIRLIRFSSQCRLPITMRYATPETLGTDRIANAVGANALYPGENVLSIMAGTCLVADFVNADGEYLGGSIAPGMRMRFQALSQFTARLPLVNPEPVDFFIGDDTRSSILSGVINGMAREIDGLIAQYEREFSGLKVIFSGGDSELLQKFIKKRIFAAPNPTLFGLHKILVLNVSED